MMRKVRMFTMGLIIYLFGRVIGRMVRRRGRGGGKGMEEGVAD
jgi:hypothetical protein